MVALLLLALTAFNLRYAGRIYPGVHVAGIDLSGLRPNEASELLNQRLTYLDNGRIAFYHAEQIWEASPRTLGLYLDAQSSARAAFETGRSGSLPTRLGVQFNTWQRSVNLPPLLVSDQRLAARFLQRIAEELDTPAVEAQLQINGLEVVTVPGEIGYSVDIETSLAPLEEQLRSLTDGLFPVVLRAHPPAILDAAPQAELARLILSAPLTLQVPQAAEGDPGPWRLAPEELAQLLSIERIEDGNGARYGLRLVAERLTGTLSEAAAGLTRQPENARFIFNDDTRELELIQPAVIGRTLNVAASIEQINQQALEGSHTIDLVLEETPPAVTDAVSAAKLGITELVHAETSYFYGSSASRMQNIETAASRFHGILVPPGATFSMAEILGDVSLDNGYAEALIIYGDRTIKGVGGGVCQVSTTLFRTVFFSGFPVLERHSHAYRVTYYELTANGSVNQRLAGLDATVFVPVVDFKFQNDTPHWLLMETYINIPARTLTWKFYSTSDGRTVDWDSTGLQNVEDPPEPLYQENPELDKGEIEQIDWAVEGADVTVFRTVTRDGQTYLEDTFSTHYVPWRAIYEYGPGTKIPKDKKDKND